MLSNRMLPLCSHYRLSGTNQDNLGTVESETLSIISQEIFSDCSTFQISHLRIFCFQWLTYANTPNSKKIRSFKWPQAFQMRYSMYTASSCVKYYFFVAFTVSIQTEYVPHYHIHLSTIKLCRLS